jgi:hypothetical protein
MKKNALYILIVIISSQITVLRVSAQQGTLITGVIKENGTVNRVGQAGIVNRKTNGVVSSNDLGMFQIRANIGDTLVVFKSDFSDAEVVVRSYKDLVVQLNKGNMLNQVNIYGQTKKQEMDAIKKDFRDKGAFFAGKPPILSYFFSPLTAVYELFGRTPRNARRFGKYYANELQQTEIDGFFNEALIKKHTELQGKELEDFMLNYRPDYSVASKWTEYDAIKYIRDSYKKYSDTLKKK